MKLTRTIPTLNFGQQKFQVSGWPLCIPTACILMAASYLYWLSAYLTQIIQPLFTFAPKNHPHQHLWFCLDLGVLKKDVSHLTPVGSSIFSASLLEKTQISLFMTISLSVIFYHLGGHSRTRLPSWTHVKTFFSATLFQRDILLL